MTFRLSFLLLLSALAVGLARAGDFVIKLGDEIELGEDESVEILAKYKIDITPEDILGADSIILPTGEKLDRENEDVEEEWTTVSFYNDKDEDAIITVDPEEQTVEGDISLADGSIFEIRTDGEGGHIWIVANSDEMEVDDVVLTLEDNREFALSRDYQSLLEKGQNDRTTMVDISIRVYFTKEWQADNPDVKGTIENIIAQTNEGYQNSNIKIKMVLECIERYDKPEIIDGLTMLKAFDAYKGDIKSLLGSADIAAILVKNSNVGGIAWGSAPSWPTSLSVGKYIPIHVFGHETGHTFGAGHDKATMISGEEGIPVPPYAMGYLIPGTTKLTVMSYEQGEHQRVINYYSSGTIKDKEGDAVGNAETDNARAMNDRRFLYPDMGDESASCPVEPNFIAGSEGTQPPTEKPSTEKPSTDNPSTDNPSTDNPSTDNPSTDNPTTEWTDDGSWEIVTGTWSTWTSDDGSWPFTTDSWYYYK